MELAKCDFETSKQLKDVGFRNYTEDCYNAKSGEPICIAHGLNHAEHSLVATYPLALVQMWLREKHSISIEMNSEFDIDSNGRIWWSVGLYDLQNDAQPFSISELDNALDNEFESPDKALEAGILEAIKLIKTRQDV